MTTSRSGNPVYLKDMDVRDAKFPVYVDPSAGTFEAEYAGHNYYGETLEALYTKLMTVTKRAAVKISIRFGVVTRKTSWQGGWSYIKWGTITGKHASNSNYLVRWDGQQGTTQERLSAATVVAPMESEEETELLRLGEAARAVQEAYSEFLKNHTLNPGDTVTEYINRETGTQDA